MDIYISKATWRLKTLAAAWGCSVGQVINRLVMETDERYGKVLFPETE
jgi:hypothetical protein